MQMNSKSFYEEFWENYLFAVQNEGNFYFRVPTSKIRRDHIEAWHSREFAPPDVIRVMPGANDYDVPQFGAHMLFISLPDFLPI